MGFNQDQDQDENALRLRFAKLQQEHNDYATAIHAMEQSGCDQLQIQRMKKKKLVAKDELTKLSSRILPNIIA